MKMFLRVILLVLAVSSGLTAQPVYLDDYYSLHNNFFPCDENTENEKKLLAYLKNFLDGLKIRYTQDKVENDQILTGTYLLNVKLPAINPSNETIFIVCPLNSPLIYQEFYDHSLTINLMTELVLKLQNHPLNKNIELVFAGGVNRPENGLAGFEKLIDEHRNSTRSITMILDLLSTRSPVRLTGSVNKRPLPRRFLKNFYDHPREGFYFESAEVLRSKMSLLKEDGYPEYFLRNHMLALCFTNREKPEHPVFHYTKAELKDLTGYFYEWILYFNTLEFPLDIDYNYQLIGLPGYPLIIPEAVQVMTLILLIVLILFLRLFLKVFQRLRINRIVKIIPYFILMFLFFTLLTFLPDLIIYFFRTALHLDLQLIQFPMLYFLSLFIIPAMIILILFDWINLLPFPKHNYLYIYGAVVFSYMNLFLFLLIDISFAYIYLWVVIIITLSNFTGKNFILKFILYTLTPVPAFKLLLDISLSQDIGQYFGRFTHPVLIHLGFALFSFPFLLLLIRMKIISRYRFLIDPGKWVYGTGLLISTAVLILLYLALAYNFLDQDAEVSLKVISDGRTSSLRMDSSRILRSFTVTEEGFQGIHRLVNKKSGEFELNHYKIWDQIGIHKTVFRDYNRYQIVIDSEYSMDRVRIVLAVPVNLYPLEADFNYEKLSSLPENTGLDPKDFEFYTFITPRNPGKNFQMNLTLIPDSRYRIYVQTSYSLIPDDFLQINLKNALFRKETEFRQTLSLE